MVRYFENQFLRIFSVHIRKAVVLYLPLLFVYFPVLALPDLVNPQTDPLLKDLRCRFVQATKAYLLKEGESSSLELRGEYMERHGIPEDRVDLYKPHSPVVTQGLILRSPEPGYLHRQGLYLGHRLLFGNGYLVPSFLVQFNQAQTGTSWILEVLPEVKGFATLQDLQEHSANPSLGVHFLGSLLFPYQSMTASSFTTLGREERVLLQRTLSSKDIMETTVEDCMESTTEGWMEVSPMSVPSNPLFPLLQKEVIPDSLRSSLKKKKVIQILPFWMAALMEVEKVASDLGFAERLSLSEDTFSQFATLLHKVIGLVSHPYALTYAEMTKLLGSSTPLAPLTRHPGMDMKTQGFLTLTHLFFNHAREDWTEVLEPMGVAFGDYGHHFRKEASCLRDPKVVIQALHKNRNPSVLTFMLSGGLDPKDLGEALLTVVRVSGQQLDHRRSIDWIKALTGACVPLEQQDSDGNTALDLGLLQKKHALIGALIEGGAGFTVKPHLIMDYLRSLGADQGSFQKYLTLLEFRNHAFRWQMTLEALLPVHTGQISAGSLVVRTTDQERVLSPDSVRVLFKEGKVEPKYFRSFTESSDPTQTKYGRRMVGRITQGSYTLYVKQFPELPGIEEAVGAFMRQLLGYGAPHTLLANIGGSAYLFSEGIPGRPLHDYLIGKSQIPWSRVSDNLDPEALSGMMLLAMLTHPEDGKPDNHIVQECMDGTFRVVTIDNDHAFIPTVSRVQGKCKMNVKTILFTLDQMGQELHPTLKRKFLYHNPRSVIEEWIKTLMERACQYEELFTPKEVVRHFKDHQSFLGIGLHPSVVVALYRNMVSLQHLVESKQTLTHMDILRRFHGGIFLRYKAGHDALPEGNPLDRFKHVDGKEYKLDKKEELQTLSTGPQLLSTNMMITTQKALMDYVQKKRGQEIRLDTALETLQKIAEQDSHLLVEQVLRQSGVTTPFETMTDPQRESFLKELDWSKLAIPQQQALLGAIARISWGDPKQNLGPWRGKLVFRNCRGFTERTFFTKGFDQQMSWENIHEVRIIIDGAGGKEAYMEAAKALQPTHVPLRMELRDLTLTDEDLDLMSIQGNIQQLVLHRCDGLKEPELRQKEPNVVWRDWVKLQKELKSQIRTVIMEGCEELNLSKIKIGPEGVQALAAVLPRTKIHTLVLGQNDIGPEGVKALAAVLPRTQIHTLNLEGKEMGPEGAHALWAVLPRTQIHTLNLERNDIGTEGARALAAVLLRTQIHELHLAHNDIGPKGAKALAAVLKDTKIHTLNLANNGIGDEGTKALAAVLKDTKIHTLNLYCNNIGPGGVRALGAVLKDTKIYVLNLGNKPYRWRYNSCMTQTLEEAIRFGGEGALALAAGLPGTKIHTLNLEGNYIGDEGISALTAVLPHTQIHTLNLVNNGIIPEDVKALAAVLPLTKIHTLDLAGNAIRVDGVRALMAVLPDTQIHTLNLCYNEIEVDQETQIKRLLKANKEKQDLLGAEKDQKKEEHDGYRALPPSNEHLGTLPHPSASEEDLEVLLSQAGVRGIAQKRVFANNGERARFLMSQNNPDTYPTIFRLLEDSMGTETSELSPENLIPPEERVSLLESLSVVYPKALLLLAEVHRQSGEISRTLEALTAALKYQIPDTLECITRFYQAEGHTQYALLLAQNSLHGYMGPVDLGRAEEWLREALSKDPKNPDIMTQLAQVLLDKGGLEDNALYEELSKLLSDACAQNHGAALSLTLMIKELQQSRCLKEVPLSHTGQQYTAREQRLLRALHQSQFERPSLVGLELTPDQEEALGRLREHQCQERERLFTEIETLQEDLERALPLDRLVIEDQILKSKQQLREVLEGQHQEMKQVLFPKSMGATSQLKEFHQILSDSLRQQFALLDAIEGGLADRKDTSFLEKGLKEAAAAAMGKVGTFVISSLPVPASGILAMVVEKVAQMGVDQITSILQQKITAYYDGQAEEARRGVREVTQGYRNSTLVADTLAAGYAYRLQNIVPVLTPKSLRELATRLSANTMGYLQDKRRLTSPQNMTQLMVMGFYYSGGSSVGDVLKKVRGKYGVKKIDGSWMGYDQVFRPLIETTDGAQYQVASQHQQECKNDENVLPHIVPLVEREFLMDPRLQGTQVKLIDKSLPKLPPFQVEIIKEQDDVDYTRRALAFVASL